MATVCELSAQFDEAGTVLYSMFADNVDVARQWGTHWDIVRDETLETVDGALVRQLWGFTTAYARLDGMGGHVSFLLKFIGYPSGATEINVVVTSPYEKNGRRSAYYHRSHRVGLRLLEFCVAPYNQIHPRVGAIERLINSFRRSPTQHSTP